MRSARPMDKAATTSPERKTRDLATSPAGAHRMEAMIAPASATPPPIKARLVDPWTARVKRATRRATSAGRGTVTSHWTNATAAITENTADGARRLQISGRTRAAWKTMFSGRSTPKLGGNAIQATKRRTAIPASLRRWCSVSHARKRSPQVRTRSMSHCHSPDVHRSTPDAVTAPLSRGFRGLSIRLEDDA